METAKPETAIEAHVAAPEAAPAAASTAPRIETVDLERPIQRGDQTIAKLQLREPGSGELRGINLKQLIQGDSDSLFTLLPRITMPPLIAEEVAKLGAADIAALGGVISSFFMSKAEKQMIAEFMGLDPEATKALTG